jgi:hypothetical protein
LGLHQRAETEIRSFAGRQDFTEWRSLQAETEKDVRTGQKDCGYREKEAGHGVKIKPKKDHEASKVIRP